MPANKVKSDLEHFIGKCPKSQMFLGEPNLTKTGYFFSKKQARNYEHIEEMLIFYLYENNRFHSFFLFTT